MKTFISYLEEVFLKDYHGSKDDFEVAFDAWLSAQDGNDLIQHAGDAICVNIKEIETPLKVVLDFVERWNKQDKEVEVAEATRKLEEIIKLN